MSEDSVKRLRAVVPYQGKSAVAFLCHEAADEIEKLHARTLRRVEARDTIDRRAMIALLRQLAKLVDQPDEWSRGQKVALEALADTFERGEYLEAPSHE